MQNIPLNDLENISYQKSKMLKGWFETNSLSSDINTNYLPFDVLSASPEFLGLINITIALSSVGLGIMFM